jgi:hypothetical protein
LSWKANISTGKGHLSRLPRLGKAQEAVVKLKVDSVDEVRYSQGWTTPSADYPGQVISPRW